MRARPGTRQWAGGTPARDACPSRDPAWASGTSKGICARPGTRHGRRHARRLCTPVPAPGMAGGTPAGRARHSANRHLGLMGVTPPATATGQRSRPPSPRIKAAYKACPLSRFLLRPCRPLLFSSFHFLLPILSRQGIFLAAASNGLGGPFLLRCKKPEGTHPASLQAFVFLPAGGQICLPVSRSVNTAS